MLKDNFYKIRFASPVRETGGIGFPPISEYSFSIGLNRDHPVFEGHFPGNPVVPGVCQVEIIKELVSGIVEKDITLASSDNIKFLNMISPKANPDVNVKLTIKMKTVDQWDVSATISKGDLVFIKFKGIFR